MTATPYQQEQRDLAEARRQWNRLSQEGRQAISPEGLCMAEARLTGDLSEILGVVSQREGLDHKYTSRTSFEDFQKTGNSISALMALLTWPKESLPEELRWFLQKALAPVVRAALAASDDDVPKASRIYDELIKNFGLAGKKGRGSDGLSQYRRRMEALKAHDIFELKKSEQNNVRKRAVPAAAEALGIGESTMEKRLKAERSLRKS